MIVNPTYIVFLSELGAFIIIGMLLSILLYMIPEKAHPTHIKLATKGELLFIPSISNFLRNVGWLGKYDIVSAFHTFAPNLVQIDRTKGNMIDNTITVLRKHKQS